jgi:hypothetical protein
MIAIVMISRGILVWYYDMHTNFWSEILNDGHQAGELGERRCVIVTGFQVTLQKVLDWIYLGRIGGLLLIW